MIIRKGSFADALAIGRVQVDSWRTTYADIVPADYLANLSYEQQGQLWGHYLSTLGSAAAMYVAETTAKEVVGFAHSGPERSGHPLYTGELYALYLLAAYQRQGLGHQLTDAVVNGLLHHGLSSMLVWVLAANPFRAFYEALGVQPERATSPASAELQSVLQTAVSAPDPLTRTNAVRYLGTHGQNNPQARATLEQLARNDANDEVKKAAAEALQHRE